MCSDYVAILLLQEIFVQILLKCYKKALQITYLDFLAGRKNFSSFKLIILDILGFLNFSLF